MVKGSRARKCHICHKIVGYSVPEKSLSMEPFTFIFRTAKMQWNDSYGGHDGTGYICKDCAAAREGAMK